MTIIPSPEDYSQKCNQVVHIKVTEILKHLPSPHIEIIMDFLHQEFAQSHHCKIDDNLKILM